MATTGTHTTSPEARDAESLPDLGECTAITGRDAGQEERRRSGRLDQDTLRCSLGRVRDLSAGGMRVITRSVPRGRFPVRLRGLGGLLILTGRLAWARRIGLFKWELGIRFDEPEGDVKRGLTQLAMTNRRQRSI